MMQPFLLKMRRSIQRYILTQQELNSQQLSIQTSFARVDVIS